MDDSNIVYAKFDAALKKFEEIFIKDKSPICFFVTGSYYQKKLKENSDIDIFVVSKPSTTREKGIIIIDKIKISYFINPINKVYNLLLSERNEIKRPTSEMIFYSKSFMDLKIAKELKQLAKKSVVSKLSKKSKEEIKYYSWKLFDKLESYIHETNPIKFSFLEVDLFEFCIEVFILILKRNYRPHTKYTLECINKLDKKFYILITRYLTDVTDRKNHIISLANYLLLKLKFDNRAYSYNSSI